VEVLAGPVTLRALSHAGFRVSRQKLAKRGYKRVGGDQSATLLHEMFHLESVSASGRNLIEGELDMATSSAGYGRSFGDAMRANCGPEKPEGVS
jgi:hypothetical protein